MTQNYCEIKKNKIYADIYDELLDEELSMNNNEHNNKIKSWITKKILNLNYIELSDCFESMEDIIADIIIKITTDANNTKLQGNTLLMFADDDNMYELFYMEDLNRLYQKDEVNNLQDDLNEFAIISNIFLQPIYWGCGIVKSNYSNGVIKGAKITKQDISNIFIQNYYHIGIMVNHDETMLELEFTGEDPIKIIGTNFTQLNTTDIIGFDIVPWIENSSGTKKLNKLATKLLNKEVYGRLFITLVCPTTNKKFWNITKTTIINILKILNDDKLFNELHNKNMSDKMLVNPFYQLNKYLKNI